MMKQIQATHAPDGRDLNVRTLLQIIEEILHQAAPNNIPDTASGSRLAQEDALDDRALQSEIADLLEVSAYTVNRITCEINCKCSEGDAHQTTVALFNKLSNYSWDAKVVLALSAFAVISGEFWIVAQVYTTNPLAKLVALIKQFPDMLEHADTLKPKFEAVNNLKKVMLDVTKCIVEFKELPSQYITADMPEMVTATANIPIAVYWTIRSMVATAFQIISLIGMGHEYMATTEAWELLSLAQKLSNIHIHLTRQLNLCYQHIDEKRHVEAYRTLVRLFEIPHIDNMKILKALVYTKDGQQPLYDGSSKIKVNIDILRMKNVLLVISEPDVFSEELLVLDQMYTESRQQPGRAESQYEILWLPVVDRSTPWTEEKQREFEDLQASMLWYSVSHPAMLDPAVLKYIKEVWHFNKKPLLVVLNPHGQVTNPNALHMMWIWGSRAFPFTSAKEEALWREETWKIQFLADSIEPLIFQWIAEGKYICLYGGEDMEWIRKFTKTLRGVAMKANIPLEMVYVGKSNPRQKVRKNTAAIEEEKLSRTVAEWTQIWFFWVRLESMWHSKVQSGRKVEDDPIMQEIMTMLSFDGSEQGWAVISKGQTEMAKAKGDTIQTSLENFEAWEERVPEIGFLPALLENLEVLHTPHHCNRLILPETTEKIPERVVCAECGRPMEKFFMYRCCTD